MTYVVWRFSGMEWDLGRWGKEMEWAGNICKWTGIWARTELGIEMEMYLYRMLELAVKVERAGVMITYIYFENSERMLEQ